jgi:hypothetical protein
MTHLRAEWTTFANLKDYFDVSMQALVDSVNKIAMVNPEWDKATEKEKDEGAVDRILIRLPGCMGTLDEMPLTLNVSTGQKSKSDKKFGGHLVDIADLTLEEGMMAEWAVQLREEQHQLGKVEGESSKKTGLRGKQRMRCRSTKQNKVGTLVMGSMANGDPYIPLVIVRSAKLAKEHTFSYIEGDDGKPLKVTLPKLRIAGKCRDAFVVATPNGGMNVNLFSEYLEKCVFPCHPLMSPTEQCVFFWDGDESHMLPGSKLRELKERGAIIVPPKPNTTTDCQGPDLVNFPVVQQRVRAGCSHRQRMVRRLNSEKRRALDYRDIVAVVGPAIEKGFSRPNNLAAWEESGLCPFGEKPLFADHIQATKGKTVKKNTLNYDVLDWSKPVHPQMMEQIGKGNRLTSGKICGKPMTDEENVKLFEGLEKEKAVAANGSAALARQKAKKPIPGDDDLLKAWEDQKMEEAKVKLKFARAREVRGEATAADEKLFNSRIVKKNELGAAPPPTPAPKTKTKTKATKKRKRSEDDDIVDSDDSDDSEDEDDGKDLLKKKWMDEELDAECTVTRRTSFLGQRALWYTYTHDGETQKERSSVEEVREWVQQFGS